MKKVYIVGHLKDKGVQSSVDLEGWLRGKFFYPDKNNARIFYKVVTCHLNWDTGIYAKHIEDIEDD